MATYKSKGAMQTDAYRHLIVEAFKELEAQAKVRRIVRRDLTEQDFREIIHMAKQKLSHGKTMTDVIQSAVLDYLSAR